MTVFCSISKLHITQSVFERCLRLSIMLVVLDDRLININWY